jgi:competence protein ComEA
MNFSKKPSIALFIIAAAIIFGSGAYYAKINNTAPIVYTSIDNNTEDSTSTVIVHVAGEVVNPGIYTFTSDKRVDDAVKKAVPLPNADLDALNLAQLLTDGAKIYVPSIIRDSSMNETFDKNNQYSTLVNINTATQAELETLPGIGPALAQRIINYRETVGGFTKIDDIKSVSGIGEKRFEQIKSLISVY